MMASEWVKRLFGAHLNLKNNRWEPAVDELAVYFNTSDLSGVLTKTLRVPSGCRARLLMDNKVEDINEGEREQPIENLWQRINGVFGGRDGEVLITRNAALPVPFEFKNLLCGDLKRVDAALALRVEVGEVQRFRNHFMRQPGAVNVTQLQGLLSAAVRQIVGEFVHTQTLAELQADPAGVRGKLQTRLDRDLQGVLREHGLNLQSLEYLAWAHEPTAEERDATAFEKRREETRQRYSQGTLKAEEAESAAALRDRDLDLLERIKNADTREQAIRLGAAEAVEDLESEYHRRRQQREQRLWGDRLQAEDERTEWAHLKTLATIRRQSLEESTRTARAAEAQLAAERFANALAKLRIESDIEQDRLIEDEAKRKASLALDMEKMGKVWLREESLTQTQHQIQIDTLVFEAGLRKRDQLRVQQWDDAQLEAEIAKLRVSTAENVTRAEQSGLRGLVELKHQHGLNKLELELRQKRGNMEVDMDRVDRELANELKRGEAERQTASAQREDEIRKATIFGSLPPEALAAMVSEPGQLSTITQLFRIRTQAGMAPEQIHAMNNESVSQSAGAAAGLNAQQVEGAVGQAVSREVQQLLERWRQDESRQWDRFDRMHSEGMRDIKDVAGMVSVTAIEMAKALGHQQAAAPAQQPQYGASAPAAGGGYQMPPMQATAAPPAGQTIYQTVQQCGPSLVGMKICCHVIHASHATICEICRKPF